MSLSIIYAIFGLAMIVYLLVAGAGSLFRERPEIEGYKYLQLRNMEDSTGEYYVSKAVKEPGGRYMAVVERKHSFMYVKIVYAASQHGLELEVDEAYERLKLERSIFHRKK